MYKNDAVTKPIDVLCIYPINLKIYFVIHQNASKSKVLLGEVNVSPSEVNVSPSEVNVSPSEVNVSPREVNVSPKLFRRFLVIREST